MSDWWDAPDLGRRERFIVRVLGRERLTRWADKADAAEAKRQANRCTWTTAAGQDRCVRKAGHRGLCRTEYTTGGAQSWYGINYPDRRSI